MRRIWLSGLLLAAAVAAGFLFFTERPLTVAIVQPNMMWPFASTGSALSRREYSAASASRWAPP